MYQETAKACFAYYRETLSTRRLILYFDVEILIAELSK